VFHISSDFFLHINWAETLFSEATIYPGGAIYDDGTILPHFLFQAVVALIAVLPSIGVFEAGVIVALVCQVITGAIIFWLLYTVLQTRGWASGGLMVALALALMIQAPLSTQWAGYGLIYGYLPPNVYHNPTILLLRPLALPFFLYVLRCFPAADAPRAGRWDIAAAALLTILGGYTKPNYLIVALPVLGLLMGVQLLRRRPVDWWLSIVGIIIPAVVVLFAQYTITFGSNDSNSIIFAPLLFFTNANVDHILLKFLASTAFPLVAYGLYFQEAREDGPLNLAWLMFGVGAAYAYLLAESERYASGNFLWGAELTLFIMFIYTVRFLVQTVQHSESGWRSPHLWIAAGVLLLHTLSGIGWYYHQTFTQAYIR
jgi:hypothetical protein